MDLVVNRDHNGHHRVLHPLKPQLSMLFINIADVKISIPQILALRGRIKLKGTDRMKQILLFIGKLFPLYRASGIFPVKGVPRLSSQTERQRLMLVQISQRLAHFLNLMAQILDDIFQIDHMVVGQPLHLCDLPDRHILFPAVDLHLLDPLSGPGQVAFCLPDFHDPAGIDHVIAQVKLLILSVHEVLEIHLHLPVNLRQLCRDAECRQDLVKGHLFHHAAVLFIKIVQDPIFYKPLRHRE